MNDNRPGVRKYPHIFESVKIGKFTSRNRVKYAACSVSNFNTFDGHITDREYARMEVIVRTGAGIITNQGAYPDPKGEGKAYYRQLAIYDDAYLPGFRKIADMIHAHGAIALQQILHGGRYGGIDLDYCLQPSAVPQTLRHFRPPREMTKDEIRQVIADHVAAARRSMEAGFDGVEITAFMGYLLANFVSKFTNKRTDEYGGSLENRARFMVELIQETRQAIGRDALLVIRLNGEELMDEYGGNTPEECIELMRYAEQAGVDMVSIVVGWHESRTGALGRDVHTDHWLYLAENAKKVLKVPVAFGPRFSDPLQAEKALAAGKVDFWELCRPFLADPDLLHKVEQDRIEEIRPCVGGLLCLARMFRNLPYNCAVNPRLSHEVEPEYDLKPAAVKKRVLIIGAGPAGLECAMTAAQRGHQVMLYEKRDRLGGQLVAASKEPEGGYIWNQLVRYYEGQLKKFGVEVKLGTEVTPQLVSQLNPNVAVVATGAYINGTGTQGDKVLLAYDVLEDKVDVGNKVVVLSGERAGLVTAEYLASRGKKVTIVEPSRRLGEDVIATFKWRHAAWVKEYGIETLTSARVKDIANGSVRVVDGSGQETLIPADTVVVAGPRQSRQELMSALEFIVDELYVIGDAVRPRSVHNAIHEGYRVGVRV